MLAEERLRRIVELVDGRGSVTASELVELLGASESTIRRDLIRLAAEGRVAKVHGGATSLARTMVSTDQSTVERGAVNLDAKRAIARAAAGLVGADDFVYIDAGSTTGCMVPFLEGSGATFVTDSVAIARALAARGLRVLLPAGELKPVTEAVVGEQTVASLARYRFTLGFFGVNGVGAGTGLTTPEPGEALVKETALARSRRAYVLADSSKFSQVAPVSFGSVDDAAIITESPQDALRDLTEVIVAPVEQ